MDKWEILRVAPLLFIRFYSIPFFQVWTLDLQIEINSEALIGTYTN
jgi:hypothetical protein